MTRIIETLVTLGGLVMVQSSTAIAQELPPPIDPLEIPNLEEAARQQFPIVDPPPSRDREINIQSPPPLVSPGNFTGGYRVEVIGSSPSLLSQVQEVEPEAFVRSGENVIQVGLFTNVANAQQRLRTLTDRGIEGTIVTLGATSVNPQLNSQFNPQLNSQFNPPSGLETGNSGYFVIIPGLERDLPNLASQAIELGAQRENVSQRQSPRGPHVAVGPFGNSGNAHRWSHYFRSSGLDARVYFQR